MKKNISHPVYGEIIYEESVWSGKKSISMKGIPLKCISKNVYTLEDGEYTIQVNLRGSALAGVALCIQNEEIWVINKPAWYDWVLSMIPFVLMIVWGNSVQLCSIIPVVGGAIGGALGGAAMVMTMFMIRGKSIVRKLLTALLSTLITFAIGAALGYAIVFAIYGMMS